MKAGAAAALLSLLAAVALVPTQAAGEHSASRLIEEETDTGASNEEENAAPEHRADVDFMKVLLGNVSTECKEEIQRVYAGGEDPKSVTSGCKKEIERAVRKENRRADREKARSSAQSNDDPKTELDELWDPTPVIVGFVATCLAGVVGFVAWAQAQVAKLPEATSTRKTKQRKNNNKKKEKGGMRKQ